MRVAQVNLQRDWGGAERHVALLSQGLRKAGEQVLVCSDPRGRLFRETQSAGLESRAVSALNQLDLAAGIRLAAALRRFRPQILHLHTPRDFMCGFVASRLLKECALAITRHMLLPVKPVMRGIYRRADVIFCLSSQLEEHLEQEGIPRPILRAVRPGIDTSLFASEQALTQRARYRAEWGLRPGDIAFGIVGRLVKGKGHGCLLSALSLAFRDECAEYARLIIIGDGPERARTEQQVRDLGLQDRVYFTGFSADIPGMLAGLDVAVLASIGELLPLAVMEAMAAGLPVLATDVGGVGGLVETGVTGLLVAPNCPSAMAQGIVRLAVGGALRRDMGERGMARAGSYTLEGTVADTIATYRIISRA